MKRMLAWQYAYLLSEFVLVEADGAGVLIKVGVGFLGWEEGFAESSARMGGGIFVAFAACCMIAKTRIVLQIIITLILIMIISQIRHVGLVPQFQIIITIIT